MKKLRNAFGIITALTLLVVVPAAAITDGELDGDAHPNVGLMIFDVNGSPAFRCSGTMISRRVMLTAGHCTFGTSGGRVWFDSTEAEILAKGYPFEGRGSTEFVSISTHPLFDPFAFFLHDLGIVILSKPVKSNDFGVLPGLNVLDQMATERGTQNVTFTAVGYGLQQINPVFVQAERTRMVAHPRLIQINVPGFTGDFSILLSNNHSTGGTCFGDSGGPNFIGDSNVIGGVTSFGINGNCAGTGGVYRVDTADDLDWLASMGL